MCSLSGELLSTPDFEEISKKLTVFGSDLASVINKIVPLQEVLIMGDDISLVEHVIKMLLYQSKLSYQADGLNICRVQCRYDAVSLPKLYRNLESR